MGQLLPAVRGITDARKGAQCGLRDVCRSAAEEQHCDSMLKGLCGTDMILSTGDDTHLVRGVGGEHDTLGGRLPHFL